MKRKTLHTIKTLALLMNMFLVGSVLLAQAPPALLNPNSQTKFINPLPIPSVIDKREGGKLTIEAKPMTQWLGIVDNAGNKLSTNLFGYNGTYPGPTILAKKFEPLSVNWDNKLVDATGKPLPHLLPIDNTIHWAFGDGMFTSSIASSGIPLVTHLHGGHTEWQSDGYPTAWYTPNYTLKGKDFQKATYYYKNDQEAATIWYHDHTLGLTRVNVMAGLAGLYVITDENEEELQESKRLPAAPYDIPLFLQDRQFKADGQIFYPSDPTDFYNGDVLAGIPNALPATSIIPEFFGNFMLVNGMTWPVLEVEPRQYRFRVLNGSDSRMYNLMLLKSSDATLDRIMNPMMQYDPSLVGLNMTQIGTDDGLLSVPAPLQKMFIAPGERKDIIVDFSGLTAGEYILTNNANGPFPMGDMVDEHTSVIMKFKVSKPLNTKYPLTAIPGTLRPTITALTPTNPATPRQVILKEVRDEYGRLRPSLGTVKDGAMMWMDPTTESVQLNDTEEWEIYNETMDAHPIHLHSVKMQLVNRQFYSAMEFDPSSLATKAPQINVAMSSASPHMSSVNMTNGLSVMASMTPNDGAGKLTEIKMIGNPILPTADELGWKDTWVIYPGQVMRVRAKFDLPGNYVWHCHILSHEDHDMMRPLEVVANNTTLPANDFLSTLKLKTIPNPFTEKCMVQFYLKASAKVTIELISAQGQVVKSVFKGTLNQGAQNFTINGGDLPTGTFACKVTVDNQVISTNVVHLAK